MSYHSIAKSKTCLEGTARYLSGSNSHLPQVSPPLFYSCQLLAESKAPNQLPKDAYQLIVRDLVIAVCLIYLSVFSVLSLLFEQHSLICVVEITLIRDLSGVMMKSAAWLLSSFNLTPPCFLLLLLLQLQSSRIVVGVLDFAIHIIGVRFSLIHLPLHQRLPKVLLMELCSI